MRRIFPGRALTRAEITKRHRQKTGGAGDRAWRKANPKKLREYKRRWWNKLIAPLLKEQKNRCAICRKLMAHPFWDHSHKCRCGKNKGCEKCRRGLLCPTCNSHIASLEKAGWLLKALAYLRRWK